jgi:hypothetical protein
MNTKLQVKYILYVRDAKTHAIKSERHGINTVLDSCLTNLANGQGTAGCFENLCVGSSAAANYIPGGVITFTQALTTITATAPFFTAPMVGGIFKFGHGTGGLEAYIQSIGGGGTTAVVDVSRTVPVGDAGTVWLTQQTKLVNFSFNYDAYVTSPGACSTTPVYAGGVATVTQQRTYIINSKVAPYTINEIGWGNATGANPNINGRFVLGAPEVIGVSDYVVITLQLIFTLQPPTPVVSTAGDQVWQQYQGTAAFNGSFSMDVWRTQKILSNGVTTDYNNSGQFSGGIDRMSSCGLYLITNAFFVQNAHVGATPPANSSGLLGSGLTNWAQVVGQYPGVSQVVINYSFNTAGGTLYGIGFGDYYNAGQVVVTMVPNWSGGVPATLPIGSFPIQTAWQNNWTRPLINP